MLNEEELEKTLLDIILDICEVLYQHGYREVPVGAVMRLIGVADERAQLHDQEVFNLDEDFVNQISRRQFMLDTKIPPNTTLH
jgi:hypothetical protein